MANIVEPESVKSIRENPNRLALVYSGGLSGSLYTQGYCNGTEVIKYIDALLAKIADANCNGTEVIEHIDALLAKIADAK